MAEFEDTTKAILRPRNEGEELKVKEVVLKRRDQNLKATADRAKKIASERLKKKQAGRPEQITTPALLVKKQLQKQKERFRLRRLNKNAATGGQGLAKGTKVKFSKETGKNTQGSVIVAVRNRRSESGNKESGQMLKQLKLRKYNSLIFLPNDAETLRQLAIVGPYVYYGFPSFKLVNDILHRKAAFKAPGSSLRVALSSNQLVEEHLGDEGLLCVEDLVDRIYRGKAEEIRAVTDKLWPVELGDFTQHKAENFKINVWEHKSGNLKRTISKHIESIL